MKTKINLCFGNEKVHGLDTIKFLTQNMPESVFSMDLGLALLPTVPLKGEDFDL